MANLPRPEAIAGEVAEARYYIERASFVVNDIEHGSITIGDNPFEVPASFLYFETEEKATEVHRNLIRRLKGESFLRSHFVIKRQVKIEDKTDAFALKPVYKQQICFWVAVEKIDATLEQYKDNNQSFSGTRLRSQYQNIIRDIIRGMCQIHQEGLTHGVLKSKHVVIINGRAKFAYITDSNSGTPATDFTNLKLLFEDVLGQGHNNHELKHFHDSANVRDRTNLRRLYFHPLLMSCGERLLLVVRANTRLRYRTRSIQHQICDYGTEFGIKSTWICKVQEDAYKTVLREGLEGRDCQGQKKKREYKNESWDQFLFGRNTIVHINENIRRENDPQKKDAKLQEKSEAEVERDLSSMFPTHFTRVYDFFKLHEITPSIRLHMGELESEFERNIRIR